MKKCSIITVASFFNCFHHELDEMKIESSVYNGKNVHRKQVFHIFRKLKDFPRSFLELQDKKFSTVTAIPPFCVQKF